MLSDDDLDRMLRGSDPVGSGRLAGLPDPDDPPAVRMLARARRRLRRQRVRRMALVPAVAVALAGATAWTQAWIAGDGEGHALDSIGLNCNHPSEQWDASVDFDVLSETPVEACQRQWQEMFGVPPPSPLVACVDSGVTGSIEVYRGGPEECARHRSDPYAGPTDEQLRLGQFRSDLADRFAIETCVSYPEFRAVIIELLAEHDLTGWTTEPFQTADGPPASEEPCVDVSYYDEPARTVVIGAHVAGDPMVWP
jgi:hypothetical protein